MQAEPCGTSHVSFSKPLLLALAVVLLTACGSDAASDKSPRNTDREHFLSDQQRALESAKSAAQTMQQAAEERAQQTEESRSK